jgi:C4-type Zn-finger protein
MGWDYEVGCSKCSSKLRITERSMGIPGGKEKEQAYCPVCGELVAEHMTDGFINAQLINGED